MEERLRILVVDDDEVDRMTLRRALRQANIVSDLREAFENYEIAVDHPSFVTPAEYRDYILTYVVSGKIQDAK